MTMRLGFFGGSFDPPHCGHLAIARAAAERFALDRVLMAPTGLQPLKRGGPHAAFADRLAMTRLLCEGDERLAGSEVDAPQKDGTPNYTVQTLRTLRADYPEAELFAILGADALPELPRWREAAQLFALATWIAVSRPGHPLGKSLSADLRREMELGRVCLMDGVAIPVSSTEIRRKLRQPEDPSSAELPEAVLRYIHTHGLYAPEPLGEA